MVAGAKHVCGARTACRSGAGCLRVGVLYCHASVAPCPDQGLCRQPGYAGQDRSDRRRTDGAVHAIPPQCRLPPPHEKLRILRALSSKRGQLAETRKRLLAQIRAHEKLGTADMFAGMDGDLKTLPDRQDAEVEARIERLIAADDELASTAAILRSNASRIASALPANPTRSSLSPSPANSSQSQMPCAGHDQKWAHQAT